MHSPTLVADIRHDELPLQDRTVFELVLLLRDSGWEWKRLPSRRAALHDLEPFVVGGSKVWFSNSTTVDICYLAALLSAETLAASGVVNIRHGQIKGYYKSLLKGRPDLAEAAVARRLALVADVAVDDTMLEDRRLKRISRGLVGGRPSPFSLRMCGVRNMKALFMACMMYSSFFHPPISIPP